MNWLQDFIVNSIACTVVFFLGRYDMRREIRANTKHRFSCAYCKAAGEVFKISSNDRTVFNTMADDHLRIRH